MSRLSIVDIRRTLRHSHQTTLDLVKKIDEETACYRPQPNAWSIKEHVIHLVAVEESILNFANRIISENNPVSPLCYDENFDQKAWNHHEVEERADYSWAEACDVLEQSHGEMIALLGRIPENLLFRVGSHPLWGEPVTLASILRIPYRHERDHRNEIAILAEIKTGIKRFRKTLE